MSAALKSKWNLLFFQRDGKLYFEFGKSLIPIEKEIPVDVINQGNGAVLAYVVGAMAPDLERWENEDRRWREFIGNLNVSVDAVAGDGTRLKGRVVADNSPQALFRLCLESPYHSERVIREGFATAMTGKFRDMFDGCAISEKGFELIRDYLKELYNAEAYKGIIRMAKELNDDPRI